MILVGGGEGGVGYKSERALLRFGREYFQR
jgi:hypothetical protein